MSIYKRGGVYWFEFVFNGSRIRESAQTTSKTIAKQAEQQRRRDLEIATNRIPKRARTPLFRIASEEWLAAQAGLADKTIAAYKQFVKKLNVEFGDRLIVDINLDDIGRLQRKRQAQEKSPRTINYEVHTLRLVLKHFNLWWPLADKVRMLRGERRPGRALSREEENQLLGEIRKSHSPALLPLFVTSIDTGLRASEIRALKRGDVTLVRENGEITGEVVVRRSKTEAGTGRVVPLTRRAAADIAAWLEQIPEAGPEAHLFPKYQIGFEGNTRRLKMCNMEFDKPMGEWKTAWRRALTESKVKARWHDLRHSLVSRLAEQPNVSEETIRALAGHVSRQMLSRYAHIRAEAKRAAIATLDFDLDTLKRINSEKDSPQKSPQSFSAPKPMLN